MTHPYRELGDRHFWSRSVGAPAPGHLDPVTRSLLIGATDKVSTIGSCFAQHLSENIAQSGFNYFVAEPAPAGMSEIEARRKNYGVFSARFGNIYTPRQALQLFYRAYGHGSFGEHIWQKDGKFYDAFRPLVEPNGYGAADWLKEDRTRHLQCVRRFFEDSDWIIFTLGLTEAWQSREDGAVFPLAPGVAAGEFDEHAHQFVNFSVAQVVEDLKQLVTRVVSVNPDVKILLTVSPVPLIATYEQRHVLVSSTYSKSVLRVAADEMERFFSNVIYFPSYEIITSPSSGSRYYEDDLRQVTKAGVKHVMRIFSNHFLQSSPKAKKSRTEILPSALITSGPVCDEEEIEKAIARSGYNKR